MAVHVHQLVHGLSPALAADQEEHQQVAHVSQHRVVGAGRVHRVERAVDRLGDDLALVEAADQVHLGEVLEDREEGHGGQQGALRGAGRRGLREGVRHLARAVPLLAPVVQGRQMRAHVGRRTVQDLQPERLELRPGVGESAGHRQLDDVRDRVTGGEQGRLAACRPRLLHDDPELVGPRRRRPPRLLDQELRVHRSAARVLGLLGPPHPQPLPARRLADPARTLLQLKGRGAGEGLNPLPARLARDLRARQELRGRLVLLRALHQVQDVQEVPVRSGHADVQLLLTQESVVRRVRRVRVAGRDQLYAGAPAPEDRQQDQAEHGQRHQDPENLHASSEPDGSDNWPTRSGSDPVPARIADHEAPPRRP